MTLFKENDFAMTTRSPNGGPVCVGPLIQVAGGLMVDLWTSLDPTREYWDADGQYLETPVSTDKYGPLTQVARPWGEWARARPVQMVKCDRDPGLVGHIYPHGHCLASDALFIPCDPKPAAKPSKWNVGQEASFRIAVDSGKRVNAQYRPDKPFRWRIVGDGE